MYENINLPIPSFACGETHDTPRLAAREGGPTLSKTLSILNMFVPNGVPFINSGQEVFETQPMNTGLDARENELFMLPENDPFYGKLALFDKYQFHYTTPRRWEIPDALDKVSQIRKSFLKQITNSETYVPLYTIDQPKTFIGFSYFKKGKSKKNNALLILANVNPYHEVYVRPDIEVLRHKTDNKELEGTLLYSTHEDPRPFTQFLDFNTLDIHLGPGEIKIVKL